MFARDPVSVAFDTSARRLLTRAYATAGTWVTVWLPDPTMEQRARFAALGVTDLTGPDKPSAVGGRRGGLDARTRWGRGFVRALFYQHQQFSPAGRSTQWRQRLAPRSTGALRVEVGQRVAASAQFDPMHPERGGLPPRRRIRVMLAAGGASKERAVVRLADRDRIYADNGRPAERWSDPSLRDWG